MKALTVSSVLSLVTLTLFSSASVHAQVTSNQIIKESAGSASSSSSSTMAAADGETAPLPPPPPPVVAPPLPVGVPPIFPGFAKGAGFHKSLDLNVGGGAGYGPLLASLIPGFGGVGVPPPPVGGPPVPPVTGVPPPPPLPGGFDPLLGGPGYLGFPGFLGPSYIPYSWLGSALGAKGDLLFPVVLFVFVIVGIWTVVQFLLGLIVPLIAGKLAVGKSLLASKKFARAAMPEPDPWDAHQVHQEHLDSLTDQVMPALDQNYGDSVEEIVAY